MSHAVAPPFSLLRPLLFSIPLLLSVCRSTNDSFFTKLLLVRCEDAALPLLHIFLCTTRMRSGAACAPRCGAVVLTTSFFFATLAFLVPSLPCFVSLCGPTSRPLLFERAPPLARLDPALFLFLRCFLLVAQLSFAPMSRFNLFGATVKRVHSDLRAASHTSTVRFRAKFKWKCSNFQSFGVITR